MGSLTGVTKSPPQQPQVIYMPSPVPDYDPLPDTPTTPSVPTDEETRTRTRQENLLRRARGTLGTVLTGFRGILSLNENSPQRKSLLGE